MKALLNSPKLTAYLSLTRIDKPIGIYLVLWPSLWSLWLAAEGTPHWSILLIFILGGILMRSAGCVINDYADRDIDGLVKRTETRPLVTGAVSPKEALILFAGLLVCAFILVLLTNTLTILLSLVAVALATTYPFMKRYTYLPQIVLGAAFAWSIPMAFAAITNTVPATVWLIYTVVLLWTVCYDTFYAMNDREEDLKAGVKSTAILFGDMDIAMTGSLQVMVLVALIMLGQQFQLGWIFSLSVTVTAGLFAYQQYSIKDRDPNAAFTAFLNNNWVGLVIFLGIAFDLAY